MRRVKYTGEALLARTVNDLNNRFVYPDVDTKPNPSTLGGGGGMAHVLIVSDSEPVFVQNKADYVVPSVSSAAPLQVVFDTVDALQGANGIFTIWMAGIFDLDSDVTAPSPAIIRGLGYTLVGGSSA